MLDIMEPQAGALVVRDPAAIAAAETAKALVQAAYIMALQRPRHEDQARHNILQACKRPQFAARVEYSKPVGGSKITGPSIRFAEEALRSWGNVRIETAVVYDDEHLRRIRVTCIDLETNSSFGKEIQVTKTVERRQVGKDREVLSERLNSSGQIVYIVRATDEELATKEAALISKVVRNEGLRLIPSDVVDDALDIARKTLATRDSQDPEAAKKRVLDAFGGIGVQPKAVEDYLGHNLDTVASKELEELRAIFQAIKDGEASWNDYMQAKAQAGQEQPQADPWELWPHLLKLAEDKGLPAELADNFKAYVEACAAHFKLPPSKIIENAVTGFAEKFWPTYLAWGTCTFKPAPAASPAADKPARNRKAAPADQPEPANAAQMEAIRTRLEHLKAPERYQRDLEDIMAAMPANLSFAEAKGLVEDLVAEPPVWGRVDSIINAPAQPGLGL